MKDDINVFLYLKVYRLLTCIQVISHYLMKITLNITFSNLKICLPKYEVSEDK